MTKYSLAVVALVLAVAAVVVPRRASSRQPAPTRVTDSAAAPQQAGAWTFCVNAGNVCLFTGLRVVRLADATGTHVVTQVAYHTVPCAVYGFQDRNPGGGALHCDYSEPLMDTLPVPVAMGPLNSHTVVVPKASPGSKTQDVHTGGWSGVHTDGSGSFRTTCSLAKYAFEDPIVFPGRHGVSHLHAFFGNTAMDATTTSESIVTTGNSTCRGGILNRTAYWTPAIIDGNHETVMPEEATIYYKSGYGMNPASIHVLPTGLRIVAGDRNAKGCAEVPHLELLDAGPDWRGRAGWSHHPAACPVGDMVRLTIIFPQCWDGKNLDSPNHQSHMSYPDYGSPSHCPSGHPVALPEITEHFDYPVTKGAHPGTWRLTSDMYDASKPGGLSAHADWMMGWDTETIKSIVENCLNKALDCGVGGIGANKSLF